MEMLLLAMVLGWVVKNGVKDLVHTGATAVCAVQGKPAPSWGSKRRVKRPDGAASRYFAQLWTDSWEDALARHKERHARRNAAGPGDAGTATGSFLRGDFRDGVRFTHRKWDAAWARLTMLRNLKRGRGTTRPRPGQETVPGEVVPNRDGGQDEDGVRPQDEDRPEPRTVQDEDGRTDLKFGDDPTDPTGVRSCRECGGTGINKDGGICESCRDRQEQRNQHWDEPIVQPDPSQRDCRNCTDRHWHDQYCLLVGDDPWIGTTDNQDDQQEPPVTEPLAHLTPGARAHYDRNSRLNDEHTASRNTTQEGTTMTATTTEVVGLDSAIRFCEDSARAYRAQMQAIEQTQAALAAGDVTGPAAETFSQAMEQSEAAASSMDAAAAELLRHKQVQEAYLANQGAGTRDFILAGQ